MNAVEGLDQFELWELEMFADGEDNPRISMFVAQHPALWNSWLEEYRSEQKAYGILHRFDCPSPDELRDYYWQMLGNERYQQIATHLDFCASCATELCSLEQSMAAGIDVAPQPVLESQDSDPLISQILARVDKITEQVKWTIATLASPPPSRLVPVELRSNNVASSYPSTWLYEAGDVDISFIIQRAVDESITLSGQIMADEPIGDGQIKIASGESQSQPIHATVNDVGEFTISNLSAGTYHFVATVFDTVLVVPHLALS